MATTSAAAALTVQELTSRPFIQRALQTPHLPQSVLSFFYGVDTTTTDGKDRLRSSGCHHCFQEMQGLWFAGGDAYDEICRVHFTETVRAAGGKGGQLTTSCWDPNSIDSLMAQLLLTDQLSRNVFRGTTEAFAYEDISLDLARRLSTHALLLMVENKNNDGSGGEDDDDDNNNIGNGILSGELYPPYTAFIATALMHSESMPDHEQGMELLNNALEQSRKNNDDDDEDGSAELEKWWIGQVAFGNEHKQVIERFGRYPHRNQHKGRTSTPEEVAWLNDKDRLPGWAKSQG